MAEINPQIVLPSPLQSVEWPSLVKEEFTERNLRLFFKRDDLIHPFISGNKWRKLRLNIEHCQQLKKAGILSFGGAYSNHLLALAAACQLAGIKSIGLVRGQELDKNANELLQKCAELGMELLFLTREEYALRDDWEYLSELKSEFSSYYVVPEGGKNFYGIIGCQDIVGEMELPFDDLWLPQGTCTTSVGVAMTLQEQQTLHIVPVLKGFDVEKEVKGLIMNNLNDESWVVDVLDRMVIHPNGHLGGYGKVTPELTAFIEEMQREIQVKFDPVYTGKTFKTLLDFYRTTPELENKDIVFLHTGGVFP